MMLSILLIFALNVGPGRVSASAGLTFIFPGGDTIVYNISDEDTLTFSEADNEYEEGNVSIRVYLDSLIVEFNVDSIPDITVLSSFVDSLINGFPVGATSQSRQ